MAGFQQLLFIAFGRSQRDCLRTMETMTIGDTIAADAEQLGLDHIITKQHNQPVYRPDEFVTCTAPAHFPWYWQLGQGLLDDAR